MISNSKLKLINEKKMRELKALITQCQETEDLSNNVIKLNFVTIAELLMENLELQEQINQTKDMISNKTTVLDKEIYRLNERINALSELNQKSISDKADEINHIKKELMIEIQTKSKEIHNTLNDKIKEITDKVIVAQPLTSVQLLKTQAEKYSQQFDKELTSIKNKLKEEEPKQIIKEQPAQIKLIPQIPQPKIEEMEQNSEIDQEIPIVPIKAIKWMNPSFQDDEYFKFENQTITYISDREYGVIVGVQQLKSKDHFFIHIIKKKSDMAIGVASTDESKQHIQIFYRSSRNCYNGRWNKHSMGKGFRAGEIVQVIVNMEQSLIMWKVKNHVRHQLKVHFLKDLSIKWVPFIILYGKYDQIRIVNQ